MEDFINATIDIKSLPKYEEVVFSKPHPKYRFVVGCNILAFFIFLVITPLVYSLFNPTFFNPTLWIIIVVLIGSILLITIVVSSIRYKKKGFAFRNHDVLYRSGSLATNIVIIPYNRVQHVALHEGLISRFFGLVKIEIFTAGGESSDISIPGLEKSEAENIKQLLMGKIQKQL